MVSTSRPSSLVTRKDARPGPHGKWTVSTLSPGLYSSSPAFASSCARCGAINAKSLALSRRNRLLSGRSPGGFWCAIIASCPCPASSDNNRPYQIVCAQVHRLREQRRDGFAIGTGRGQAEAVQGLFGRGAASHAEMTIRRQHPAAERRLWALATPFLDRA